MPQTTGAYSNACAAIQVSLDGIAWTDISGSAQAVAGTEQSKMSGEAYTFDGVGPIVKGGKREPLEVAFTIIYTEVLTEAYEIARGVFETAGCEIEIYARWSPGGGIPGTSWLQVNGPIISFIYPEVDASTATPIMAGFTVKTGIVTTVAATS